MTLGYASASILSGEKRQGGTLNAVPLLRGIAIGFSIAAPVGPIGVLCIQRTLAHGRAAGLATGLGAATADAVYGAIAALGLTALTGALVGTELWIRLLGGAFLLYLGLRTFFARPADRPASTSAAGLAAAYASTFFLTLTNPMTILSFLAVFAALGVGSSSADTLARVSLILGVLLGSALWWLTLSFGVGLFRSRLGSGTMRWINRISGGVIAVFGLFAIGSAH